MNGARKVVFHSVRQEDAEQKFLERRRQLAEYREDLLIIGGVNRSIWRVLDVDDNGIMARRSSGGVIFIAIAMTWRYYGPVQHWCRFQRGSESCSPCCRR